jgi:hypothetical protein
MLTYAAILEGGEP